MNRANCAEPCAWSAALVHPLALGSWSVLLLNDHWLKHAHPGWLSGKLSDVAFMVLAPLWLQAAWLLLRSWGRHGEQPGACSLARHRWSLGACMALVGTALVLMETTRWGDAAYRHGLGGLQYPFRWVWAALRGDALPRILPVSATRDLTDLLCLPALAGAWWVGAAARGRRSPGPGRHTRAMRSCSPPMTGAALALATSLATWSLPCRAQNGTVSGAAQTAASHPASPAGQASDVDPRLPERAGFFLRALPGIAFMGVDSERSALSAFQQPIPSSATAYGGSFELELGGAATRQLVFAGAIEQTSVRHVRIRVRDQVVAVEDLQFESISLGAVAVFYPWDQRGWHASAKVAFGGLNSSGAQDWPYGETLGGQDLKGPVVELSAGHDWWIGRHWWMGAATRVGYGSMTSGTHLATVSLLGTVTLL
jgi:hypothetical protein